MPHGAVVNPHPVHRPQRCVQTRMCGHHSGNFLYHTCHKDGIVTSKVPKSHLKTTKPVHGITDRKLRILQRPKTRKTLRLSPRGCVRLHSPPSLDCSLASRACINVTHLAPATLALWHGSSVVQVESGRTTELKKARSVWIRPTAVRCLNCCVGASLARRERGSLVATARASKWQVGNNVRIGIEIYLNKAGHRLFAWGQKNLERFHVLMWRPSERLNSSGS